MREEGLHSLTLLPLPPPAESTIIEGDDDDVLFRTILEASPTENQFYGEDVYGNLNSAFTATICSSILAA